MTEAAPARIEAGPVVLALQGPDDADVVAQVVNANLDHLAPWMPWAHRPTNAQEQAVRLALAAEEAARGGEAAYGILRAGRLVGGCGLHARSGDDTLDIGYWLAAEATGAGCATAAAAALTRVAFERYGKRHVRITCDEANVRSAAVARRLGFVHVATVDETRTAPADTDRTMVWELPVTQWPSSPGAAIPVSYA